MTDNTEDDIPVAIYARNLCDMLRRRPKFSSVLPFISGYINLGRPQLRCDRYLSTNNVCEPTKVNTTRDYALINKSIRARAFDSSERAKGVYIKCPHSSFYIMMSAHVYVYTQVYLLTWQLA